MGSVRTLPSLCKPLKGALTNAAKFAQNVSFDLKSYFISALKIRYNRKSRAHIKSQNVHYSWLCVMEYCQKTLSRFLTLKHSHGAIAWGNCVRQLHGALDVAVWDTWNTHRGHSQKVKGA